jgi:hypothetical protein
VEIIKTQYGVLRKTVHEPEKVRDHHSQPGPPTFAEGHNDDIGALEFVELLHATKFSLGGKDVRLRLAAHAPVQKLTREFLAARLPTLAQVLESQFHAGCPP